MDEIKPKQRIVGEKRTRVAESLAKQYEKGASIRAIAASIGRSYGFVHRILAEEGVVLRTRGGSRPTRARKRA